jgi:hypothetical protein
MVPGIIDTLTSDDTIQADDVAFWTKGLSTVEVLSLNNIVVKKIAGVTNV